MDRIGPFELGCVHRADCLDALRLLPDACVDAVVTDPPAGIAFMAKEWDDFRRARNEADAGRDNVFGRVSRHGPEYARRPREVFVAWLSGIARECLRVCKPGAHAFVWALPRTSHWTATAWEDAGWEIRDRVAHIFGCLSDDTELLVNGRWEPFLNGVAGRLALCYDTEHDSFSWQPIQQLVVYKYDDLAFRVRGASTDQIVTRDHRCVVERGGAPMFLRAEDAAREREARVPVLEDLPALLAALPVPDQGAGGAESDMLGLPGGMDCAPEAGRLSHTSSQVQAVWSEVPAEVECSDRDGSLLFSKVLGRGSVSRPGTHAPDAENGGAWPRWLDKAELGGLPGEDERRAQPGMERGRDFLSEARELQADQVRPVPAGIRADGAQGRVRHGAPPDRGAATTAMLAFDGGRAPRQPRPAGQPPGKPDAVSDESGTQGVRGERFTRSDLVRFEPIRYRGTIWCVTVPTGAFVARRAGKVFVTGNSGFPKSLDVSKAIDREAGAERAIIGVTTTLRPRASVADAGTKYGRRDDGGDSWDYKPATAPATPAARQWSGFGTSLKPAVEDWWLCRKPLDGTVAANVQRHGTGAINVDGCRIEGAPEVPGSRGNPNWRSPTVGAGFAATTRSARIDRYREHPPSGRWPANLVLSHSPDCDDSECAPDCPVRMLDEQSGERPGSGIIEKPAHCDTSHDVTPFKFHAERGVRGFDDTGGASRFFFCSKASRSEREDGLGREQRVSTKEENRVGVLNTHPT